MTNKQKIPLYLLSVVLLYKFLKKPTIAIKNIVDDLPKHPTKTYSKKTLANIDKLILHHFASDGTPQAIANYHVTPEDWQWVNGVYKNVGGRGWAGIGYHYVIAKDGTIYQTNFHETISYHVAGENSKSIGIALEGNFKIEQHRPEQITSLNFLIPYLRSQFPQPLEVYQHSDFKSTKPYDANLDLTPYKL